MRYLSFFTVALVLGLSFTFVALPSHPVQAATYYVDDDSCPDPGSGTQGDPFCSIQSGITAASSGETVQVAAGTYYEGLIWMKSGVVIQGAGQDVTTIDGGVIIATNGVDSTAKLDGFTLTNGNYANGGAMNISNSSPTVTNCTFSGNSSILGGGMYNSASSPTVINCTFTGNSASEKGGGMYNSFNSSPIVTNCTFTGNSALDIGGGMYNENSSSPTVTNCTFSANTALNGGGGMVNGDSSSPIVINCVFSGNTSDSGGGGGMHNSESSPTVTNCTFTGNSAGGGGGMYNSYSSPTVTNCTFTGNSASNNGGGILNSGSSFPTVTNCILWGNSSGEISDFNYSTSSVTYSDIQGGFTGTGNINSDPMFVDPDGPDNIPGNEDDDLHLSAGSPCIDTGTSSGAPDTDLEGNPRPQGAGYDMGAYESLSAKLKAMPWLLLLLGY